MEKKNVTIKNLKGKTFTVSSNHMCKVISSGNINEIITVKIPPSPVISNYRRLDKDRCVNLKTGEIITYKKSSKRLNNHQGLRKTFSDLRRVINANFIGDHQSELHITLTYNYNEQDYTKVAKDFSRFWSRFTYHYPGCEYIRILEPQNAGRWHIHLLVKLMNGKLLYVDYDHLRDLWGLGLIHVSEMPSSDNIGAYFSAMFTDYDAFENAECPEQNPNGWKAIVKGARFKFYPPNFRFYSCSKGIIRPKAKKMPYGEAMKLVGNSREVYTSTKQIVTEDELGNIQELNAVLYQQFNSNRTKSSEILPSVVGISDDNTNYKEKK
ncbi:MAG: rolling circle replication-associated protein [Christensenellales bacterium]|jgi:hypothetical protein